MEENLNAILDFVRTRYSSIHGSYEYIDKRMGNYLIIIGIIWGMLTQSIKFLSTAYEQSKYIFEKLAIIGLFSLSYVLILLVLIIILRIYLVFKTYILGKLDKENILKIYDSKEDYNGRIMKDIVLNYEDVNNQNVAFISERTKQFTYIKRLLIGAILSSFLYYFILLEIIFMNKRGW